MLTDLAPDLLSAASIAQNHICLSGGAKGADLMWGMCAGKAGHIVIHWSFAGQRRLAPAAEIVTLSEAQLAAAEPYCRAAGRVLGRPFPLRTSYTTNLIRRNWYQVCDAESCYAVSSLDRDGVVEGGTAWATAMFINRFSGAACPCYLFDQKEGYWLEWGDRGWVRIPCPPEPTGVWAGIGRRDLQITGKLAIRVLMRYPAALSAQA